MRLQTGGGIGWIGGVRRRHDAEPGATRANRKRVAHSLRASPLMTSQSNDAAMPRQSTLYLGSTITI